MVNSMSQKYWAKNKSVVFWLCRGRNTLHHTASPTKSINQSSLLKGGDQEKIPNPKDKCEMSRRTGQRALKHSPTLLS